VASLTAVTVSAMATPAASSRDSALPKSGVQPDCGPGSFYSVPLSSAVMVGLLGAAMALRTIVLRPRSGSDPDLVAADAVLRRRSAEAVVAATGVMVAASLSGVAFVAVLQLHRIACPPTMWTIFGLALVAA